MSTYTYLITGGAGFIGSHIAELLVQRGQRVRVFDNLTSGNRANLQTIQDKIEFCEGDVRDLPALRHAMHGVQYVIHQAAIVSVPQSVAEPIPTHEVTGGGTFNVLLAAKENGVQRVVCASTCAVYGDNANMPLRESELPQPLSPYAAAKLNGENYASAFAKVYGLSVVMLRYFNVYGLRQDPRGDYAGVIAKFMALAAQGKPPTVFGDGAATRDFVHVSDIAHANVLACHAPNGAGGVFNIGTGVASSVLDLVRAIATANNTTISPQFAPARAGDILHSCADMTQAKNRLGFAPRMALVDGLRTMVTAQ